MRETAMSDGYTDESEEEAWAAEQSPGFLLWHLENLWQRQQRRALDPFGVTTVQFLLLSGLADSGASETMSQIALAGRCRTDPMMTSQVVRTLTQMGLVERSRDNIDKRAFAVCLTEEGRALRIRAEAAVRTVEDTFFAALGSDVPAFANALRVLGGERPRQRVQASSRIT
jgi:DNA-binding MarR family transcriptional regulator